MDLRSLGSNLAKILNLGSIRIKARLGVQCLQVHGCGRQPEAAGKEEWAFKLKVA